MLLVVLDGSWIASRGQRGGMEGKIAVVGSCQRTIGTEGRHRLEPRRYVSTFDPARLLGRLSHAEAFELAALDAPCQIVLGDGADWIKREAATHFPGATAIQDWPHLKRGQPRAARGGQPVASRLSQLV